jgi:hypothetical protein
VKIESILHEWETDSTIDVLNLANDSAESPKLHSKYWNILVHERLRMKTIEQEYKSLVNDKFWFFMHGPDETSISRGWELPARGRIIVKEEAKQLVECDPEVLKLSTRLSIAKEKCHLLEDILKNIHQRSFIIKNIIDIKKFENGD